MTTSTLALTDFLLARIADDEANLPEWFVGTATEWMPIERIKAECDVKLHYIRHHRAIGVCADTDDFHLRNMAAIYADHPDYREEWKK